MYRLLILLLALLCGAMIGHASAQVSSCISTQDARLCVSTSESQPRLLTIEPRGQSGWHNGESEPLVNFAEVDGRRVPVGWRLLPQATKLTGRLLRYVFESRQPKLRLSWEWEARADFGPIEHRIRIENLDAVPIWLPLQDSLRFATPIQNSSHYVHWFVEKGADTPSETGTHHKAVAPGYKWTGFSSTYAHPILGKPREIIPWMLIRNEDSNIGFYVGVEFSGRVRLELERHGDELVGTVGLDPDPGPYRTKLSPGETFETPTVFISGFRGDADDAGNLLRRWVRKALGSRRTWSDERYPYTTNNSWGSGTDVTETVAKRMIRDSAELGLEMFHLDAGWFRSVGDWKPDPQKFPNGLGGIADEAHRAGLKFGLWMDWAQAGVGTTPEALNVNDPEVRNWTVTDLPADWKPEAYKGQTIDIGVRSAQDWVQALLKRAVSQFKLDMLEHDGYLVAQGCVRTDHPHVPPDPAKLLIQKDAGFLFAYSNNSTDVSYRATRAYYAIHESLRQEHPDLLLEVCNDGGRMVDFGSAAHGDYFSITDTYDPVSNRRAFYDTSWVLPSAMLESYVEKWPTPTIDAFRYMLRSGMMGWFSVMQDTNAWSLEQHRVARGEIALYKSKLRPLIRKANLYHVSERPDGVHWDGVEYFDQATREGVLFAFRGSGSEVTRSFHLRGVDPRREYSLHFQDHSFADKLVSGREILGKGLSVSLPNPYSSELVFIDEVTR